MSANTNFENEPLADTGFVCGWILDVVMKNDSKFMEVLKDNKVTSLTAREIGEGKGVCSKIYKTSIFANHENDEPIYNFIIKIPTTDTMDKAQKELGNDTPKMDFKWLADAHNVECDFYDVFKDVKDFPLPRVFYTRKCLLEENQLGAIFMEDLSKKMQNLDIFMSLNQFQMKDVVKHVASFHAQQLKNEKIWKNRFPALVLAEEFFITVTKMNNEKVVEARPEFGILKNLENAVYDAKNVEYSLRSCCQDLDLPALLQLGDLWTNNVIWERNEENIPNKALAFIDFSLAFEGNPAFDLARIITLCIDAEIRREMETWIFDYYYDNLTKFLNKKPDFEVEQFKKAYDYAMINQTSWMPMLTMFLPRDPNVTDTVHEARKEKLALRGKLCIEDAVEKLQKLQPDWIPTIGA